MCTAEPVQNNRIRVILILNLLNIADAVTTRIGLSMPGIEERNAIALWMIKEIGLNTMIIFKIFFVGIISYWFYLNWHDKINRIICYSVMILLFIVVINNIIIIS